MRLFPLFLGAERPLRLLSSRQSAGGASPHFARVLAEIVTTAHASSLRAVRYPLRSGDGLQGRVSTDNLSGSATSVAPAPRPRDTQPLQARRLFRPRWDGTGYERTLRVRRAPEAPFLVDTYGRMVVATARRLGVDPLLSLAIARAESGLSAATAPEIRLDPRAVSADGKSIGLFQLTAETGKTQLRRAALRQEYKPFDPQQNAYLGIGYVKYLLRVFSQETVLRSDLHTTAGADVHETRRLAIAAYNAGEGRVARAQAQARSRGGDPARYQDVAPYLPASTRRYVERVERFTAQLRTAALGVFEGVVGKKGHKEPAPAPSALGTEKNGV